MLVKKLIGLHLKKIVNKKRKSNVYITIFIFIIVFFGKSCIANTLSNTVFIEKIMDLFSFNYSVSMKVYKFFEKHPEYNSKELLLLFGDFKFRNFKKEIKINMDKIPNDLRNSKLIYFAGILGFNDYRYRRYIINNFTEKSYLEFSKIVRPFRLKMKNFIRPSYRMLKFYKIEVNPYYQMVFKNLLSAYREDFRLKLFLHKKGKLKISPLTKNCILKDVIETVNFKYKNYLFRNK